ncbi:MAG: hypothetical protein QG635_1370 [Bacteroidota bacterium]|nr:hypothetical protein [Bacteroidota bacterium]
MSVTLLLMKGAISLSLGIDNMHFEFLVEEFSARKALDNILPRLITGEHTYRIITYQGKPDILKKLPFILKGYSRWITEDMKIIILIDKDNDNCIELKQKIDNFAINANLITKSNSGSNMNYQVITRIAIEELESWFLGDADAIRIAYPKVKDFEKRKKFKNPDSINGAWEALESILQKAGYFSSGLRKVEAADKISKNMQPLKNRSKSFSVFWEGIVSCLN